MFCIFAGCRQVWASLLTSRIHCTHYHMKRYRCLAETQSDFTKIAALSAAFAIKASKVPQKNQQLFRKMISALFLLKLLLKPRFSSLTVLSLSVTSTDHLFGSESLDKT